MRRRSFFHTLASLVALPTVTDAFTHHPHASSVVRELTTQPRARDVVAMMTPQTIVRIKARESISPGASVTLSAGGFVRAMNANDDPREILGIACAVLESPGTDECDVSVVINESSSLLRGDVS